MPRYQSTKASPDARPSVNLNQVVAYNLRAARRLRGWTQEELAKRLEEASGRRVTTSTVSVLERSWLGNRRREFDVHEVALFAEVLDVPFLWFLMPPLEDSRQLEYLQHSVLDFYILLFGRDDQVESMIRRLHEIAHRAPRFSREGQDQKDRELRALPRERSYLERRMQVLLAGLEARAGALERSSQELESFIDYLREVGGQGFVKRQTNDAIYAALPFYRGLFDAPESEAEGHSGDESSPASPSDT